MKKLFYTTLYSLLFLLFLCLPSVAKEFENKAHVSLIADQDSIQPGQPFKVGILFKIEKGWHTYYKEPGEAGAPPQFHWDLPQGFEISELAWPVPLPMTEPGEIHVKGYKNELFLWAMVMPPSKISSKEVVLKLEAKWLVCENLCIPEAQVAILQLPVSSAVPKPMNQALFERHASQGQTTTQEPRPLWQFLIFAFIGGMILNAMPCVLPVISIKIFGFIKMAQEKKSRFLALGFSFICGILVSFLVLALTVVLLQNIGREIGWGFQFQYPGFVLVMTLIVFALGLSLAGVYELTFTLPESSVAWARQEGLGGAFFHGVLATILATPCTAPFLGAAIGFAFSQSAITIFLIFMTMGMGMAFPYLLLTLNPGWTRFVPKPGAWMEALKQFMAFFLFGTAVWLIWVLGRQVGLDGVTHTLAFLVLLGLACWVYGKIQFANFKKRIAWIFILVVFLLTTAHFMIRPVMLLSKPEGQIKQNGLIEWIKYTPEHFEEVMQEGKPIFLDFTADWCLTCKVNERVVLNQSEVVETFAKRGIIAFKLDWTQQDKEVTQLLKSFGRFGVPLYVYYPNGNKQPPRVLPEVLTKTILLKTLER